MKRRDPFVWRRCFGAFVATCLLLCWVPFYAACQSPEREPWQPPPIKVGDDMVGLLAAWGGLNR